MKKLISFILLALLPVVASAYDAYIDGIYYNFSGDEAEVTYSRPSGHDYSGDIVIPETITYEGINYRVTSIGSKVFAFCNELTSVTIPEGLVSIGENAFYKCMALQSINFPEGLTDIGSSAFRYCESLTSITIPGSVKNIENFVFYDCIGLTSITLSSGVTTIGDNAFHNCTSLRSITIPKGVTSIGKNAFLNCMEVTKITLPDGLKRIGYNAFIVGTKLTDIYCFSDDVPSVEGGIFENYIFDSATLHVPAGSIENYKTTSPWSEFGNIVTLSDPVTYTEGQMATIILPTVPDASKGKYYRLDRWEEGKIVFEQELHPQARVPYIIVPDEDFSIDPATLDLEGLSSDTVSIEGISFIGTYVRTELPALTGEDEGGSSFYVDIIDITPDCQRDEAFTIGALRAYLTVNWDDPINYGGSRGPQEKLEIVLKDYETGIDGIQNSEFKNQNEEGSIIYDLSGRRVNNSKFKVQSSKPQRGIYIKKGRKVVK